jgi:hypothetical protein
MMKRIVDSFARWMNHPRLGIHLVVLATVLLLPSFWIGWQLDDHTHRFVLLGEGGEEMTPIEAFSILTGDSDFNRELIDAGHLPWWTDEEYRIAFFRFLTVLTMWLDYRLWPDSPALMHVHNMLWFAALALAVVAIYRRFHGWSTIAGLAALLYVLDDARALPAAWIANRNSLLATLFGVLCIWAHVRWRRSGWKPGAFLGPLLLALALASAEIGLAAAGYLLAHALFLDRGTPLRRLAALIPNGVVLLIWVIVYRAFGFGVYGSGMYIDPVRSPIAFLDALLYRGPFLLMGQWTPLAADGGSFLAPDAQRVAWTIAVFVALVLAAALWPLLRRDPQARFWATGMVLALVPVSAAFPSNRLLMFVSFGGASLLAQFLVGIFSDAEWVPDRRAWKLPARCLAYVLVPCHLLIAPLSMPLGPLTTWYLGETEKVAAASVPSDPAIASQDLVVVNSPDYLIYVAHIPTLAHLEGRPYAARMRALAPGPVPLAVTRIDERSLDIRMEDGLFYGPLGCLFRDVERPLRAGDRFDLDGMIVTVVEVLEDGSPVEARFEFSLPLEDPSLRWIRWDDDRYVPFAPPPVGETVELPAALSFFDRIR